MSLENVNVRVERMRSKYYSTGTVGLSFFSLLFFYFVGLSLCSSTPPEVSLSAVSQQLAVGPARIHRRTGGASDVGRSTATRRRETASKTTTGQH